MKAEISSSEIKPQHTVIAFVCVPGGVFISANRRETFCNENKHFLLEKFRLVLHRFSLFVSVWFLVNIPLISGFSELPCYHNNQLYLSEPEDVTVMQGYEEKYALGCIITGV